MNVIENHPVKDGLECPSLFPPVKKISCGESGLSHSLFPYRSLGWKAPPTPPPPTTTYNVGYRPHPPLPNKTFQRGVESPSHQTILENLYKHWRHPHITCYNELTKKNPPATSGINSSITISHTPFPPLTPCIHIFKIQNI